MSDESDRNRNGDVKPSEGRQHVGEAASLLKTTRGVLCVRCEHLNPLEAEECEICQTHLYVNCHECGAKNPRIGARCVACHRRLHKARPSSSRRSGRVISMKLVLFVLGGIALAIGLLVVLAGDSLPRLW